MSDEIRKWAYDEAKSYEVTETVTGWFGRKRKVRRGLDYAEVLALANRLYDWRMAGSKGQEKPEGLPSGAGVM